VSRNLVTDVEGVTVGHATDLALGSGVTTILFDRPTVASVSVRGGAPAGRDMAVLELETTVTEVDAIVLSGGSGFGLDSTTGVQGPRHRVRGAAPADCADRHPVRPGQWR
jgi:D-aminopeptidase